jgi:hypothetical protein
MRQVVLGLAMAAWCVGARADEATPDLSPSERIEKARAATDDLSYDVALDLVKPLMTHTSGRVRLQALEITATTLLVIGKPDEARAPLKSLYDLAPGFVVADQSLPPRVTAAFEAEAAREHARVTTVRFVPDDASATSFVAATSGPATKLEVVCRSRAGGAWQPMTTHGSFGQYAFRVPTKGDNLCYAVALDADDIPLGRLGNAYAPVHLVSHEPKPITSRWWFWSGTAALVAAGVVTAVVLTRPGDSHPPQADATFVAHPLPPSP